jgi:pimeloyl-ACP methyl ester carboxylesterase
MISAAQSRRSCWRGRARKAASRSSLRSVFFLNGGLFPELHRPRPAQVALNSPLGFLVARLINKRIFERGFREVFGADTQPSAEEIDGYWTCIRHADGQRVNHLLIRYMRERKLQRERWVGALLGSPVPIGFCNGLEDPVSGRHVVEKLQRELPSAPIWELAGIGHYPQAEAAGAVLQAYAAFAATLPV